MKLSKLFVLGLFLISGFASANPYQYYSSENIYSSDSSASTLKFSVTAFQLFSLGSEARPLSISGFLGSKISDFGDVGLYVQSTFPSADLNSITHAGLKVAPKILEKSWATLLWATKAGYGNYKSSGALVIGTGLILETGHLFHVYADFLHNIPIQKDQDLYDNTFGIGLGLRLLE